MLAKGSMVHGYREVLSPHMVTVMLTSGAVVALAFALVGPIGSYHIEDPLERVAYAALYTFLCWPVFYALSMVVSYLLRFRMPLEILAGLAFAALLGSFHCSAVMHTIESLVHPSYPADAGFIHVFLLVSTSSLSCTILNFYLVWQRVRHIPPLAEPSRTSRDVPAQAPDASEVATASDGNGSSGQPPSGFSDVSPTAAVEARSADGQDGSADSRMHPSGDEPAVEQATAGPQQLDTHRRARQPRALLRNYRSFSHDHAGPGPVGSS